MTRDTGLALRYAVGTDVGRVRERNEDSAYASPRLLVVADGMGGHAHGEVASAAAIAAVVDLDTWLDSPEGAAADPLAALAGGVADAADRLAELAEQDDELRGMGTTFTGLLWDGTGFAVAHIGDSRAYLLRDGRLHQVSHDHTMVQALVDQGRMPPEQAAEHPRRSMLIRALQSGGSAEPDLFEQDACAGDRLLLCSDGLTDVVAADQIAEALADAATPDDAVPSLIGLANRAGGPDNITCVVIDVMDAGAGEPAGTAFAAGAAAADGGIEVRAAETPEPRAGSGNAGGGSGLGAGSARAGDGPELGAMQGSAGGPELGAGWGRPSGGPELGAGSGWTGGGPGVGGAAAVGVAEPVTAPLVVPTLPLPVAAAPIIVGAAAERGLAPAPADLPAGPAPHRPAGRRWLPDWAARLFAD